MPLARPMKPESPELSIASRVMGGTAKAFSAYIGGVLGPGVEVDNLETIGSNISSYSSYSFRVALPVTVHTSLGMAYA